MHYLCSLYLWITRNPLDVIVYCDNSRISMDYDPLVRFAEQHNKTLEILSFDGNREAQIYGKGYGEGRILEHVLNHSKWIQGRTIIYKITGRLFVENFQEIRAVHAQDENVYAERDTRFFKTEASFFKDVLVDKYKEVNDPQVMYLEHVYDKYLAPVMNSKVKRFSIEPKIVGRSATIHNLVYHRDYDDATITSARALFALLATQGLLTQPQ